MHNLSQVDPDLLSMLAAAQHGHHPQLPPPPTPLHEGSVLATNLGNGGSDEVVHCEDLLGQQGEEAEGDGNDD